MISLLRIEFSGMTDRDGRRTLTELINHHIKQEDYAGVLSHVWTYLDEHRATTEILYTFSYAFRKVKDYATAAEPGERISRARSSRQSCEPGLLSRKDVVASASGVFRAEGAQPGPR